MLLIRKDEERLTYYLQSSSLNEVFWYPRTLENAGQNPVKQIDEFIMVTNL